MASEGERHRLPGEHMYEGVPYMKYFPAESLDKIKTFDYRDEDILVVTYPKAGTTWLQEIVYLLMHDGDTTAARANNINERFPFIEWQDPGEESKVDKLASVQGRRFIKSHLGPQFFQKALDNTNAKFIIGMRNIKDNLVSYYHFYRNNQELGAFRGTFAEFLVLVKEKHIAQGDWFDFNLPWWGLRDNPNVLFVKFEDLIKDVQAEVTKVAEFLGKNPSDETIRTVCENVAFDVMKKNPSVNRSDNDLISTFMRQGKVGNWRQTFSMEESLELDEIYRKKMEGTGLSFTFDSPNQE